MNEHIDEGVLDPETPASRSYIEMSDSIDLQEDVVEQELPIQNAHFIRVNKRGLIIHGASESFETPLDGDIVINKFGSRRFRLFPDGVERPQLFNDYNIPLYKWEGEVVVRSVTEIQEDIDNLPIPELRPDTDIFILGFMEGFVDG